MASVKTVERQIGELEGFDVVIRHSSGRGVRSDFAGLSDYPYLKGAKNNWTASSWKAKRFYAHYPDLEVDVLDANGSSVRGNTTLGRIRDFYLED